MVCDLGLIHEHDAVFAIWLDPASPERFELIPIKGTMPNSNKELRRLKMTVIACTRTAIRPSD